MIMYILFLRINVTENNFSHMDMIMYIVYIATT